MDKARNPIIELYCAVNAILNASGKTVHKPIGGKATESRVIPEAIYRRLEEAYTDFPAQAVLDFQSLLNGNSTDPTKDGPPDNPNN